LGKKFYASFFKSGLFIIQADMKVSIFKKFIKLHIVVVGRLLVHISVPYKVKILGKTFHKVFFTPG